MLVIALAAAAALLGIVALLLYAAGHARARALAEEVRQEIEPYLRRKAAELGIPAEAPTWTSRTPPEEILAYSARLAARLLDYERTGPTEQTTRDLGMAETQPVSSSNQLIISSIKK